MEKISDEKLDWLIEGCIENKEYDCTDLSSAMQELKERREADNKPLDIKGQLRLVHEKCPDVWRQYHEHICPTVYNLKGNCDGTGFGAFEDEECEKCWDKAVEED